MTDEKSHHIEWLQFSWRARQESNLHHALLQDEENMSEPLSEVIRVRVSHSQAMRLQQSAALAGLSFSDYIRRRLTHADTLQDELSLLRQAVRQLDGLQAAQAGAIEAALLARHAARPEHRVQVENTMRMLGVDPLARVP